MPFETDRIYIAGHQGLIGSACVRLLQAQGATHLLVKTRSELDLTQTKATAAFFEQERPDYVILAAGRVGGITDNRDHPAEFMTTNLAIQLNVIRAAHDHGVKRLIFFGSSCMYPRECPQPMAETLLLTGRPEPTSIAYAMAKLAGVEMCLAYNRQYGEPRFIPLIPNSAYGPNDEFDPARSHVLSALIRRFHEAKQEGRKEVALWGTGTPCRELVYADDIAEGVLFLLRQESLTGVEFPLNMGTGVDWSIRELAETVAQVVGYQGTITWDTTKPDGAPRKLLDSSRMQKLGWRATTALESGIRSTYHWYLEHEAGS